MYQLPIIMSAFGMRFTPDPGQCADGVYTMAREELNVAVVNLCGRLIKRTGYAKCSCRRFEIIRNLQRFVSNNSIVKCRIRYQMGCLCFINKDLHSKIPAE